MGDVRHGQRDVVLYPRLGLVGHGELAGVVFRRATKQGWVHQLHPPVDPESQVHQHKRTLSRTVPSDVSLELINPSNTLPSMTFRTLTTAEPTIEISTASNMGDGMFGILG